MEVQTEYTPGSLFQGLGQKLSKYLGEEQVEGVRQAFNYAETMHRGQSRRSGDPYITHPLAVADILADMHLDEKTLSAAILHDIIEDTTSDLRSIRERFGDTIAELVDGVSKLDKIENSSPNETQSNNFHKMVMATARDVRVILVKLADRLHNMRTISALSLPRRKRIARETLDYFAPIARRLGMENLRMELEELCFSTLHPMRARRISSAIDDASHNRRDLVDKAREKIGTALKQRKIRARIVGRQKNPYSIYRKMGETRRTFEEIMDVFGFRVIVKDINTCYRTLGVLHQIYKPIQGYFKDYIALPKDNGYQSLHTILFGPYGVRIEIQIRTQAMDQMASNGIASHAFYKLGEEASKIGHNLRIRQWINGLLELQKNPETPAFNEQLRADLFPDEIYVFSPKGDIFKLPKGATPVDFAYALHTDIGNHCVGCLINRKPAALSTPLENSQTIKITTAKESSPNPSWINFVITEKARSHIRQHLRQRQRDEALILGRQLLSRSLLSLDASIDDLDENKIVALLKQYDLQNQDELLAEIGFGNRSAALIARKLVTDDTQDRSNWWNLPRYFKIGSRHQPLLINGTEGMMVHFGHCCSPIPGDPIIGAFNPGRGMVVHTSSCRTITRGKKTGDTVPLEWSENIEGDFTTRLRISVIEGRGALAELAALANSQNANLEKLLLEQGSGDGYGELYLGVKDRIHLAKIIRKIRALKSVTKVTRINN